MTRGKPRKKPLGLWPRFRRNERGVTVIEFSMVAAPFIALLLAIFETTITMFTQQTMETAVEDVSRQIMTGSVQKNSVTQAQFKTKVCSALPDYIKCSGVMVDVRTATSLSSADTSTPAITYNGSGQPTNSWSYDPGDPGDVVIMRVLYLFPVVSGPLNFSLANAPNSRRLLVSTSIFRNENF
ncbi:MAG TPA: TadE/TadG family type IV pilus assembly protein [Sphingobium sp.]